MLRLCCCVILLFLSVQINANQNTGSREQVAGRRVLNIYTWAGEIPDQVVRVFEKETGIKVNLSTYENNEVLYAKLRASKNPGYDIVVPSSYFVDRMRQQNMLLALDKTRLSHLKNLNPQFTNPAYDPDLRYSIPYLWGITGIFVNKEYFQPQQLKNWNDLWDPRYRNQLMLLDDIRENFSIALLTLGYPPNDTNPQHIKEAYLKLKALMPNVKLFSTDTVVSNMIDDDATIGTAWNGDVFRASRENQSLQFIFPQEGFMIWVDNLCIPKSAPHIDNAYKFINFMLRADIAKNVSLISAFPTANLAGQQLLPDDIKNNTLLYPPENVLKRGQFQIDLGDEVLNLYEKYWEELKMGA